MERERPAGQQTARRFLDPAVIARLGTLELKAKTIVEGFLSGLHRSPFKGFSVEFAEYRQYIRGDDVFELNEAGCRKKGAQLHTHWLRDVSTA